MPFTADVGWMVLVSPGRSDEHTPVGTPDFLTNLGSALSKATLDSSLKRYQFRPLEPSSASQGQGPTTKEGKLPGVFSRIARIGFYQPWPRCAVTPITRVQALLESCRSSLRLLPTLLFLLTFIPYPGTGSAAEPPSSVSLAWGGGKKDELAVHLHFTLNLELDPLPQAGITIPVTTDYWSWLHRGAHGVWNRQYLYHPDILREYTSLAP